MNILNTYKDITVVCGGNFDRQDLVDFEVANALDDDFRDIMT